MADPLNYQPSHSAAYYTPPSQFDLKRLPLNLAISALLIAVVAAIYAKIEYSLELIYYRGAAAVGVAVAVGLLCVLPVRAGRVRSVAIAVTVGAILSLWALYAMWVVWVHEVLYKAVSYGFLIAHATGLWRLIREINRFGVYQIQRETVRGWTLFFWWFGEGAMIVAAGTLFPLRGLFTGDPICRQCGTKCKRVPNFPNFAANQQNEIASAIESRSFEGLSGMPAPASENAPELRVRLMSCPRCEGMHVLTLLRLAWVRGQNGRATVKITPVVNELLITTEEAEQLKGVCQKIREEREAEADQAEEEPDAAG